jgi:hypothetical protein
MAPDREARILEDLQDAVQRMHVLARSPRIVLASGTRAQGARPMAWQALFERSFGGELPRVSYRGAPASALTTVLALLVMVGPWLGKLHRIVHWQAADAQVHAASGFEHAFGQHNQVSDCLSFDQLSLGAQWPELDEAGLPELFPPAPAWPGVAAVPVRPFAAFRARAPPDRLA